jgi:fucose 4-O-acetylase-like acetyltransferase
MLVLVVTWLSAGGYLRKAMAYLSPKDFLSFGPRLLLPMVTIFLIPQSPFWWLALFLLVSELTREALALLTNKTASPRYWGLLGLLGLFLFVLKIQGQSVTAFWACALVASLCEVFKILFEERARLSA